MSEEIDFITNGGCDDCPECRYAIGIGQATNICKVIGYKDCDALMDMVMKEEMSPSDLLDTMIERTKESNTEYRETFESIKKLMSTPINEMVIEND